MNFIHTYNTVIVLLSICCVRFHSIISSENCSHQLCKATGKKRHDCLGLASPEKKYKNAEAGALVSRAVALLSKCI